MKIFAEMKSRWQLLKSLPKWFPLVALLRGLVAALCFIAFVIAFGVIFNEVINLFQKIGIVIPL